MNALTKALVVVVTILAVILVALVIPFAARVPDYAQQYRDAEQALQAQVKSASESAAEFRAQLAEKGNQTEAAAQKEQQLSAELAGVKADNTALQAKLSQAENTMARMTAALEVANRVNENKDSQVAELSTLVQKQITSLGEQQSRIADISQALINVREENRRLSTNYLRIQEENKALAQRVSEAQALAEQLKTTVLALGGDPDKPASPKPPVAIRGSVVKVDQINDGLTFVQLNIGTRDLVEKGMVFTVSRGDAFIGNVQIAEVDTAESVGRVTLLEGTLQEGDAARAGGN